MDRGHACAGFDVTRHRVLLSLETDMGERCVDLFVRSDGGYGFEVYRRDSEEGRGWYPVGGYQDQRYASKAELRIAAERVVSWIAWDGVDWENLK